MLTMTLTVTGIDKTIKNLTETARGLGDYRDFLRKEVVPELKKEFRRVFASRGYGQWRPLAASTIAEKRKAGYPTAPLIRTNYYRRASVALRGMRIRRHVLEIKSPVPYARFHEFGTRRIPQRQVFSAVAQQLEPRLRRLYEIYYQRSIRR